MKSAMVENGVVVNVILGILEGYIECPDDVGIGWTYDGSVFSQPAQAPIPLDDIIENLGVRREAAETGGMKINGVNVATDRHTQTQLTGLRALAKEDPNYMVTWKGVDGFVDLDAAEIIEMADGVRQHVQDCFNNENNLRNVILASDNPAAVDIEQGWPSYE
jgi:hypothetical protein